MFYCEFDYIFGSTLAMGQKGRSADQFSQPYGEFVIVSYYGRPSGEGNCLLEIVSENSDRADANCCAIPMIKMLLLIDAMCPLVQGLRKPKVLVILNAFSITGDQVPFHCPGISCSDGQDGIIRKVAHITEKLTPKLKRLDSLPRTSNEITNDSSKHFNSSVVSLRTKTVGVEKNGK
jgi:hypothetical protein|nr:hypothetical protein [uncultured Halomonas sp.]